MANWYIDRSRNISSILQSNYFHKLCDLATKEVNNYSSRELIDLLGIAEDMKNPNALLTFLRDIGLINANTNIPSTFECCIHWKYTLVCTVHSCPNKHIVRQSYFFIIINFSTQLIN
jgi:hypothetical protein